MVGLWGVEVLQWSAVLLSVFTALLSIAGASRDLSGRAGGPGLARCPSPATSVTMSSISCTQLTPVMHFVMLGRVSHP